MKKKIKIEIEVQQTFGTIDETTSRLIRSITKAVHRKSFWSGFNRHKFNVNNISAKTGEETI